MLNFSVFFLVAIQTNLAENPEVAPLWKCVQQTFQ